MSVNGTATHAPAGDEEQHNEMMLLEGLLGALTLTEPGQSTEASHAYMLELNPRSDDSDRFLGRGRSPKDVDETEVLFGEFKDALDECSAVLDQEDDLWPSFVESELPVRDARNVLDAQSSVPLTSTREEVL